MDQTLLLRNIPLQAIVAVLLQTTDWILVAKASDNTPMIKLRNLGPVCEAGLASIGIRTAGDIRKLGVKETFIRLMAQRERDGSGGKCYNAAYLYAIYGAVHDIDWRDLPDKKKAEFKAFTASMRSNGEEPGSQSPATTEEPGYNR